MPIRALHQVRPMRGRTRPKLMYCEDGNLYVVKLSSNPKGPKVLVSEYFASEVGRRAGLPIPKCEIIDMDPFLLLSNEELSQGRLIARSANLEDTLHCGSPFVGGINGKVFDMLPASYLEALPSHRIFGGMLVFDKFLSKLDDRQAVFHQTVLDSEEEPDFHYEPYFIDHDESFGGAKWTFSATLMDGIFPRRAVYDYITGLESFEPYLSRCVEEVTLDSLWDISKEIPASWYHHDKNALEALVESLWLRVLDVHSSLLNLRAASTLFPNWLRSAYSRPMIFPESVRTGDLPRSSSEV